MARRSFKAGALTAPLPPVMVTVGDGKEINVITIGWTGILSTIPPRTYISVRPERHSYKLLKRNGEFVINLTRAEDARIVDYVGIYTGAKVDKFKECGLKTADSTHVTPPTLENSPLALECRVIEVIPMGTHDVFIADIVGVSADESVIDDKGKLRFDRAGLLAYAHGEYFALGDKLGSFGFSTRKDKETARPGRAAAVKKSHGTAQTDKKENKTHKKSKDVRTDAGDKNADGAEKKRPYYLDAPRKHTSSGRTRKGGKHK